MDSIPFGQKLSKKNKSDIKSRPDIEFMRVYIWSNGIIKLFIVDFESFLNAFNALSLVIAKSTIVYG